MKSLETGKGDSSQPLNLQQRVIQSGLDSLTGVDAESIELLFKGMAVFAEDVLIPVDVLIVLFVSMSPNHKSLSAIKVRHWTGMLLARSLINGSVSEVSMHDIISM